VRWWNVKHPTRYAQALSAGHSPGAGRELLDEPTRRTERVMLGVRLRQGLAVDEVSSAVVDDLVRDELVDPAARADGRVVVTRRGRLLADAVVRRLLEDG
jgi:oxygen-independent coproporphyrinogen-3 oxidase